jgi:flavin-binding protein dodecin
MQVVEEKARVEDGEIVEYLVTLKVIFLLEDGSET